MLLPDVDTDGEIDVVVVVVVVDGGRSEYEPRDPIGLLG